LSGRFTFFFHGSPLFIWLFARLYLNVTVAIFLLSLLRSGRLVAYRSSPTTTIAYYAGMLYLQFCTTPAINIRRPSLAYIFSSPPPSPLYSLSVIAPAADSILVSASPVRCLLCTSAHCNSTNRCRLVARQPPSTSLLISSILHSARQLLLCTLC